MKGALVVVLSLLALTNGHMWLRTPVSRAGEASSGGTTGPCANLKAGTGKRTVFEAGQAATFAFRVNLHGTAPFKVAFSTGADTEFTTILKDNIANTVSAGPDDFNGVFVPVTIPETLCETCSIQLSGMGQSDGSGKWYQCADIKIVAKGSLGIPTTGKISPANGPTEGGTEVTITGTNFGTAQSATLMCSFELATAKATWISSTSIKCSSPPSNVNKEAVVKVTTDGTVYSTSGVVFNYTGVAIPPVITNVDPAAGKAGTKITINGDHFYSPSMECKFGTSFVPATVISTTQATCYSPTFLTVGESAVEVSVDGSPYSVSGRKFIVTTAESSAMILIPQLSLFFVALFFIVFA